MTRLPADADQVINAVDAGETIDHVAARLGLRTATAIMWYQRKAAIIAARLAQMPRLSEFLHEIVTQ